MNVDKLSNTKFDIEIAREKIERNFDFLMNDYMQSIENRAIEQLKEIIL